MNATTVTRFLAVCSTLALLIIPVTLAGPPAHAQSVAQGASGLPLPRFVSLKARRVNLRIGPSRDYAVEWMYTRSGIPMEIIQEGWIHKSLLTGERTAIVAPWKRGQDKVYVQLRARPQVSATLLAMLEPGVVVNISECNGNWCRSEIDGAKGWVAQNEIWGAYPGEAFK